MISKPKPVSIAKNYTHTQKFSQIISASRLNLPTAMFPKQKGVRKLAVLM